MEAAKTPFYENAEPPLTAEDVQNLVLISQDYNRGSRTTVYDFECDIRGEHDKLQYTLQYHDDGEGFTIHTEKNDIWERMPEPELSRLEGILGREALYYLKKLSSPQSFRRISLLSTTLFLLSTSMRRISDSRCDSSVSLPSNCRI